MAVFLVSYQLHQKTSQGYTKLIETIESFDHQKVQDSLWLVSADAEPVEVAVVLANAVEGDDKLFIAEVTMRSFAHMNSIEGTEQFLETRNLLSLLDES